MVDTGFFRYSNTKSQTLRFAAELVEAGATTWNVNRNLEERNAPAKLRLLSLCLNTIDYMYDGKVAIIILTNQMMREAGANVEMAEEFINFPRSVEGVEIAVLLREKNSGEYKISLRSKDVVDVTEIARKFGGGGHKHAAGCDIEGSLGHVKKIIMSLIGETLTKAGLT